MKEQTAVEWLYENILLTPLDIRSINKCLEQAKEMEKEQILESYKHGQNNGYMYRDGNSNIIQAEQYYNETYESNT
jgi:hypothetical protein